MRTIEIIRAGLNSRSRSQNIFTGLMVGVIPLLIAFGIIVILGSVAAPGIPIWISSLDLALGNNAFAALLTSLMGSLVFGVLATLDFTKAYYEGREKLQPPFRESDNPTPATPTPTVSDVSITLGAAQPDAVLAGRNDSAPAGHPDSDSDDVSSLLKKR